MVLVFTFILHNLILHQISGRCWQNPFSWTGHWRTDSGGQTLPCYTGKEKIFCFQMPNSPLTHHHTWHVSAHTSPSKLWFCNLYPRLVFLLCSLHVSVKARPVKCIFYLKSEVRFSSLRNKWAPNISKLIADVFLSIKLKKKPNSYSVLLLMGFML